MICERCLKVVCDPDDASIDSEGIPTCDECIAEERAHHEAEWNASRDPWAEDGAAHETDCRCDGCNDRRTAAAEHRWEASLDK